MGMAASQARFLGLTARKTNVEYEGQQINQQRTTLANQSANYYSQLLGMTVPVPPSVDEYTKTVYTFNDGALTNSITSLIAQNDGKYLVSYNTSWTDDFTPVYKVSHIVTTKGDDLEGEQLYQDFINSNLSGCYAYLNNPANANQSNNYMASHIIHVINHMLGPGTYTTTDGNTLTVGEKGGSQIDSIYWTKPSGSFGGDGEGMAKIAEKLKGKPIVQKLTDLLYQTKQAYKSNRVTDDLLNSFRDQLNNIVENDLERALQATYMVGADTLREMGYIMDVTYNPDGSINEYIGNDEYLKTLSSQQLEETIAQENRYIELLEEKYGDDIWFVRYIKNTTTGEYEPTFYRKSDLKNAVYGDTGASLSTIPCYKMGSSQKTEEVKCVPAVIEKDSTGRYINITLNPESDKATTYALTVNTLTDQDAYDDAMNQYEYDKYRYEQTIQEINAKIEIIQTQDKNLELRLKQLDTEQNAISTEMDAVEKIIQNNTESTFKTFG